MRRLGLLLLWNIVKAVAPVGDRLALLDHPDVQILGTEIADGDRSAVSVNVARVAGHRAAVDMVRQCESSRRAATIVTPSGILAELPPLRRANAVQPDSCPVNVDRVAVDDRGVADQVSRRGRNSKPDQGEAEAMAAARSMGVAYNPGWGLSQQFPDASSRLFSLLERLVRRHRYGAKPGPTVQYLMNDRASMLDIGTLRMQRALDQTFGHR